jgi:hypothetical protein
MLGRCVVISLQIKTVLNELHILADKGAMASNHLFQTGERLTPQTFVW